MNRTDIDTITAYRDNCRALYESGVNDVDLDVIEEMERFVDGLVSRHDWRIEAEDTGRWFYLDGWYEVAFWLRTDVGDVYIKTESGGRELEELWSEDNPQDVDSISSCYMHHDSSWVWWQFMDGLLGICGKIK
ncbi:MAG: hypothetical protein J6Y37_00330 [Paludibacteraceae bacterium]|nr:hypothetical protein [Paludibacteraceae bacterium]